MIREPAGIQLSGCSSCECYSHNGLKMEEEQVKYGPCDADQTLHTFSVFFQWAIFVVWSISDKTTPNSCVKWNKLFYLLFFFCYMDFFSFIIYFCYFWIFILVASFVKMLNLEKWKAIIKYELLKKYILKPWTRSKINVH